MPSIFLQFIKNFWKKRLQKKAHTIFLKLKNGDKLNSVPKNLENSVWVTSVAVGIPMLRVSKFPEYFSIKQIKNSFPLQHCTFSPDIFHYSQLKSLLMYVHREIFMKGKHLVNHHSAPTQNTQAM